MNDANDSTKALPNQALPNQALPNQALPNQALPNQAAVAVIVNSDRLLTIKRSVTVRAPGQHCFPGGGIEEGETVEDAIVREMQEELNILVRPLEPVWESIAPSGVELFWHLTLIEPGQKIVPNTDEVESFQWMTISEIHELPNLLASNAEFFKALDANEFKLELGSL